MKKLFFLSLCLLLVLSPLTALSFLTADGQSVGQEGDAAAVTAAMDRMETHPQYAGTYLENGKRIVLFQSGTPAEFLGLLEKGGLTVRTVKYSQAELERLMDRACGLMGNPFYEIAAAGIDTKENRVFVEVVGLTPKKAQALRELLAGTSDLALLSVEGFAQTSEELYAESLIRTHLSEYQREKGPDLYPAAYAGCYRSDEYNVWLRLTDADDPDSQALRKMAEKEGIPVQPAQYSYSFLLSLKKEVEGKREGLSQELPITNCYIDVRNNQVVVLISDLSDSLREIFWQKVSDSPAIRLSSYYVDIVEDPAE